MFVDNMQHIFFFFKKYNFITSIDDKKEMLGSVNFFHHMNEVFYFANLEIRNFPINYLSIELRYGWNG